jgi:hypothetical protein
MLNLSYMKTIITLLLSFVLLVPAMAQDEEDMVKEPKAQEKIKAARIAYITEKLGLTPAEAEKFWPIYNEFSQKRKELKVQYKIDRKVDAQSTDQNQKEAVAAQLQFKQKELDLEKDYSNRLLNVVPAQKVMSLRRAETDFRNLLIRQIQQRQNLQEKRQIQRDRNDLRLKQRNN